MNHYRSARIVGLGIAAVLTFGVHATVAAQDAWLEMDVVDAQGRSWRPTDGDPVIDLGDALERELTLSARSLVDGVASFVFSVDGIALGTVDAAPSQRGERTAAVVDGRDDAEEILVPSRADAVRWPAGFTYHSSSDIELGTDPTHGPQLVYIAFEGIELPAGGRVVYAEVRFTADGDSSGPLDLAIAGVATLSPETELQDVEGSASALLSALPRTTATVAWTPEAEWVGEELYATPDLTPIVLEAWGSDATPGPKSLALTFEGVDGDGTRRAYSYDSREGRSGARASLYLTVEEPVPSQPTSVALPDGDVVLTVTAHAGSGGAGTPLASFDVRVTGGASAAPQPPETPSTPTTTTEPAPEPAPEPAAAPAPAPAPTPAPEPAAEPTPAPEPAAESTPGRPAAIRAVDLRSRSDGMSLLTVVLDVPAAAEVTPLVRFGTCANPGAVLLALRTVLIGQDGSVTEIEVSAAALRLGGFVVALEGDSNACMPLD